MILLEFISGKKTKVGKCVRPNFWEAIYGVLSDYFATNVAEYLAREFNYKIQSAMEFPEDGIYKYENEKFYILKDWNSWEDTGKGPKDYFLKADDPIFEFLKFSDTNLSNSIKDCIIAKTEKMFSVSNLKCITISDELEIFPVMDFVKSQAKSNTYSALFEVSRNYLRKNPSEKITADIIRIIFEGNDENSVIPVIHSKTYEVTLLLKDQIIKLDKAKERELRAYLKGIILDEYYIAKWINQIYNSLIWYIDCGQPINIVDSGYAYTSSNGIKSRFSLYDYIKRNVYIWSIYISNKELQNSIVEYLKKADDLEKCYTELTTVQQIKIYIGEVWKISVNVDNSHFIKLICTDEFSQDVKVYLDRDSESKLRITTDERERESCSWYDVEKV